MKHHPSCPDGLHTHPVTRLVVWTPHVVFDGSRIVAIADRAEIAERIAELLDRHGLADIPDDPAALTWPAPDPNTRKETP